MHTSAARYELAKKIALGVFFIKRNIKVPGEAAKKSSFDYATYRLLRPVLKVYYSVFKLFYPMSPWTSPASILIFKRLLTKEMTGIEYGSGKSTAFLARHLGHLTSIEHHKGWHRRVSHWLHAKGIKNVEYFLVEPDAADTAFLPPLRAHLPAGLETKKGFANYINMLSAFEDNSVDFLLIDGRARTKCALIGIHKLKQGGILVLDNSERNWYQPVHHAVRHWPHVFTTTGLTDTTIWFKPD